MLDSVSGKAESRWIQRLANESAEFGRKWLWDGGEPYTRLQKSHQRF